jgi:Protein of unknown function (DUF3810)
MNSQKRWIYLSILLAFAIIIHWFSANAARVEAFYSTGFYVNFSSFCRLLLGWLPFSVGDVLYFLAIVWLLYKLIQWIKMLFKKQITFAKIYAALYKSIYISLWIYICFNCFWAINYNRFGIAKQLQLNIQNYSVVDLQTVNALLLQKVNDCKQTLIKNNSTTLTNPQLFKKTTEAYKNLQVTHPFLQYKNASLKSSMWGWLGNYIGFTGYYNPFTAEAQVNTTVPKFLQPFTACHEVAHQLGYAKEMEANFVGYLACTASTDTAFQYAVYIELFLFANSNLYKTDTTTAKQYSRALLQPVKDDLLQWRKFNQQHANPVEPAIRWLYGKYLQGNQQPQGILSYNEVTGFLIAYYKKFGKI